MENSAKRIADINDIQNKITERQTIISNYTYFGALNRSDAIYKITELRVTNEAVGKVYAAHVVTAPSIPLENCSDCQLINELNVQVIILQVELMQKLKEETESHAHP